MKAFKLNNKLIKVGSNVIGTQSTLSYPNNIFLYPFTSGITPPDKGWTIYWGFVEGATSFLIRYRIGTEPYTEVETFGTFDLEYHIPLPKDASNVNVQVASKNSTQTSEFSDWVYSE